MNLIPFLSPAVLRIGSTSALAISQEKKVLFFEPARVAVSMQSGLILAFGNRADELSHLGAPDIVVQPIFRSGIPVDMQLTSAYLTWMRDRLVVSRLRRAIPSAVVTVVSALFPPPYAELYSQALRSAHFIPLASYPAVLGDAWSWAGSKIRSQSVVIVRMGATTTQVALISHDTVVSATTIQIGGEDLDRDISRFIRRRHHISVPASSVAFVKEAMTKASYSKTPLSVVIRGKKVDSHRVASVTLTEVDLAAVCSEFFDMLSARIAPSLSAFPPDVEVVLSGGLSVFTLAAERLQRHVPAKIRVLNRPLLASVLGIGSKIVN